MVIPAQWVWAKSRMRKWLKCVIVGFSRRASHSTTRHSEQCHPLARESLGLSSALGGTDDLDSFCKLELG